MAGIGLVVLSSLLVMSLLVGADSWSTDTEIRADTASDIPRRLLEAYQDAAGDTGVPTVLLAGIGKTQTDHGRRAPGEVITRGTDPGTELTPALVPAISSSGGEGLFLTSPGALKHPQRPARAVVELAELIVDVDVDGVDLGELIDGDLEDPDTQVMWTQVLDALPLANPGASRSALAAALLYAGLVPPAGSSIGQVAGIPYAEAFNRTATLGVDPRLVTAVAWKESNFDPEVVSCARPSPAGALGIMQLMPGTAAELGVDPCSPEAAIDAGARYLRGLHDQLGSWELALAGYNAGPGAVQLHGGIPPYRETQRYVTDVMAKWVEYQQQFPGGAIEAGARTATGPNGEQLGLREVAAPGGGVITVNTVIADQLTGLLAAAEADGVLLAGSGFRSNADQVALREAHCGAGYYNIHLKPASACSPPTARPGSSRHELGLAVDFKNCSTRSTACWQWLDANAAGFGFFNLPSEAWHWSDTGG